MVLGSIHVAVTAASDFVPPSSKEFREIQAAIECWFSLKRVRFMTRRYSLMHHTDRYSKNSWIIWPVWPNGWVFVQELSGSGLDSSCSHFMSRFHPCFEQGLPWHSRNYRVWIHFEMRTWHDKKIQSYWPCREVLRSGLNLLVSWAKLLSLHLRTDWFSVRVQLQSLKLQIAHLLRARSSLTFTQL